MALGDDTFVCVGDKCDSPRGVDAKDKAKAASDDSSNTALIAGIAGGVGGALLVAAGAVGSLLNTRAVLHHAQAACLVPTQVDCGLKKCDLRSLSRVTDGVAGAGVVHAQQALGRRRARAVQTIDVGSLKAQLHDEVQAGQRARPQLHDVF
eukprot:2671136-Rhodomonas_salina.3